MLGFRRILRWMHIFAGAGLSIYLFSPLHLNPVATFTAQLAAIGLAVSGLAMWQWPRVIGLSRRKGRP
jgi:hypothetical protein